MNALPRLMLFYASFLAMLLCIHNILIKKTLLILISFLCIIKNKQALWDLKGIEVMLFYLSVWIFYCWVIFFNKNSLNELYSLGREGKKKWSNCDSNT